MLYNTIPWVTLKEKKEEREGEGEECREGDREGGRQTNRHTHYWIPKQYQFMWPCVENFGVVFRSQHSSIKRYNLEDTKLSMYPRFNKNHIIMN